MQKIQGINMNDLADSLAMSVEDLSASVEFLGLMQIANEAVRLSHAEAFEKNQMQKFIDGGSRFTKKNLIAACRSMLPNLEIEESDEHFH